MNNLQFLKGKSQNLRKYPLSPGAVLFTEDTRRLYVDTDTSRIAVTGDQVAGKIFYVRLDPDAWTEQTLDKKQYWTQDITDYYDNKTDSDPTGKLSNILTEDSILFLGHTTENVLILPGQDTTSSITFTYGYFGVDAAPADEIIAQIYCPNPAVESYAPIEVFRTVFTARFLLKGNEDIHHPMWWKLSSNNLTFTQSIVIPGINLELAPGFITLSDDSLENRPELADITATASYNEATQEGEIEFKTSKAPDYNINVDVCLLLAPGYFAAEDALDAAVPDFLSGSSPEWYMVQPNNISIDKPVLAYRKADEEEVPQDWSLEVTTTFNVEKNYWILGKNTGPVFTQVMRWGDHNTSLTNEENYKISFEFKILERTGTFGAYYFSTGDNAVKLLLNAAESPKIRHILRTSDESLFPDGTVLAGPGELFTSEEKDKTYDLNTNFSIQADTIYKVDWYFYNAAASPYQKVVISGGGQPDTVVVNQPLDITMRRLSDIGLGSTYANIYSFGVVKLPQSTITLNQCLPCSTYFQNFDKVDMQPDFYPNGFTSGSNKVTFTSEEGYGTWQMNAPYRSGFQFIKDNRFLTYNGKVHIKFDFMTTGSTGWRGVTIGHTDPTNKEVRKGLTLLSINQKTIANNSHSNCLSAGGRVIGGTSAGVLIKDDANEIVTIEENQWYTYDCTLDLDNRVIYATLKKQNGEVIVPFFSTKTLPVSSSEWDLWPAEDWPSVDSPLDCFNVSCSNAADTLSLDNIMIETSKNKPFFISYSLDDDAGKFNYVTDIEYVEENSKGKLTIYYDITKNTRENNLSKGQTIEDVLLAQGTFDSGQMPKIVVMQLNNIADIHQTEGRKPVKLNGLLNSSSGDANNFDGWLKHESSMNYYVIDMGDALIERDNTYYTQYWPEPKQEARLRGKFMPLVTCRDSKDSIRFSSICETKLYNNRIQFVVKARDINKLAVEPIIQNGVITNQDEINKKDLELIVIDFL